MNKDQRLLAEAYTKICEAVEGENLYDLFDWDRMSAFVSFKPLPRREDRGIDIEKLKQTTPIRSFTKALDDDNFKVGEIYIKLDKGSPNNYSIYQVTQITKEGPIFTNQNSLSYLASSRPREKKYTSPKGIETKYNLYQGFREPGASRDPKNLNYNSSGNPVSNSSYLVGPFNDSEIVKGFENILSAGKSDYESKEAYFKGEEEKYRRGEISSVNYD